MLYSITYSKCDQQRVRRSDKSCWRLVLAEITAVDAEAQARRALTSSLTSHKLVPQLTCSTGKCILTINYKGYARMQGLTHQYDHWFARDLAQHANKAASVHASATTSPMCTGFLHGTMCSLYITGHGLYSDPKQHFNVVCHNAA